MVAINIAFNGYRDLILPITENDKIIRNAVLAASASHISLCHAEWKDIASKYYMAAIQCLNQRTYQKENTDEYIAHSGLCTMVLLFVDRGNGYRGEGLPDPTADGAKFY